MARVNVEDDVERRLEYRQLFKLVGDDDRALGMLVRFWRLAQKYWGWGELVPLEELERAGLHPILESGWGFLEAGGVKALGAEKQFAWYRQKVQAGIRSGKLRRTATREPLNGDTPAAEPPSPSPSPSLSKNQERVENSARGKAALPHLAEVWNQHRGVLSEVRGMSKARRAKAQARWNENPSPEYWIEVVERIARSPFCRGENDRGWKATFDFLLKPETQHKVLEGVYDRKGSSFTGGGPINVTPINVGVGR